MSRAAAAALVLGVVASPAAAQGGWRPIFNGLAIAGEEGVRAVLANMAAEFDLTMRLAGCTTIAAIDRDTIRRA